MIDGKAATLDNAIATASQLLLNGKRRTITGRIRSVEGARAALAFASKIGAFVDPDGSDDAFKSIRAIQRSGMVTASMSEVRFRSDCIVLIGDDRLLESFPRLIEVLTLQASQCSLMLQRRIVAIGKWSTKSITRLRQAGNDVCSIDIDIDRIPQSFFQWSHCGSRAHSTSPNVISQWISQARYLSIVWSASQLDMPHPDLWIERLNQWILQRNAQIRCVGFPLASDYVTFQQVCTWTTGFPGRVLLEKDSFEYIPDLSSDKNRNRGIKTNSHVAVVLRIDESIGGMANKPAIVLPTVAIAPYLDVASQSARVFIPCAVAGVDHRATFFRVDATVAVESHAPLPRSHSEQALPVSEILSRMGALTSC